MVNPKNDAQNDVAAISVAKFSCTKPKRHAFIEHSPECENYQATIHNTKLYKNRASIVNQPANNASRREFYSQSIVNPVAAPLRERDCCKRVYRRYRHHYRKTHSAAAAFDTPTRHSQRFPR